MRQDSGFEKRLIDLVSREIPGFEIRKKSESKWQRALGVLLFFVPGYMKTYTTVMFGKVYLPEIAGTPDFNLGETLSHEFVHLFDAREDRLFNLKYLFPQVLALGALGAFWKLWFLLFLVFLLPIPAPWRMRYELRGYSTQIALAYWAARWPDEIQDMADWVPQHFTGPGYYWMWPFARGVDARVQSIVKSVKDGSLERELPYSLIKSALTGKNS